MAIYPTANLVYSAQYSTVVDQKHLQNLEDPNFHTHTSIHAERLHRLSETVLLPGRWNAQLLGRVIQPLPGKTKDHPLWGIAVRMTSVVLWIITIPFAAASLPLALPLRYIDHRYRPAMSYINHSSSIHAKVKTKEELLLTKDTPLHIRTHNVGFVTSSMSITGDLRSPTQRAKELVASIVGDPSKPDIIFFQETFHEDATKILCEGIKEEYPYIIHSVAPQISGFSSGAVVASKYPIENVEFQRLNHMLGPERASPRGIIKIRVESAKGPVLLYGIHTQALIGEDRAKARFHQLEEVRQFMKSDAIKEPNVLQVLVGDFNTSRVTAWGEDNLTPSGQAEEEVLQRLNHDFDDVYLRDHSPLTGERTAEHPRYLEVDNSRLSEDLPEPSGSWYHGPFANPGWLLSSKMHNDRRKHHRPTPQKVTEISVQESTWGTQKWHSKQPANTARFDYILLPKEQGMTKLDGRVEIRRVIVPQETQSASSDHLPVDGRIWTTEAGQ